MSEDCLSLNIWTPASSSDEKLPVYIWIFGGRFIFGSGSQDVFDGGNLAGKGAIVVTINYRLGIFGFLAHPELSKESGQGSGNYGILDQIAALEWVQKNIAAFGGDPDRVTIGGQSAGAASVLHLIDSSLAKGLFRGAIAQSAALHPRDQRISGLAASYRTLEVAEKQGMESVSQHGAASIAEMRILSTKELLKGNGANDNIPGGPPLFRPVFDGWVMDRTYEEALKDGSQSDVTVLAGNNHDEGTLPDSDTNLEDYITASRDKYASSADEFLALYPATSDAEAADAYNTAARDSARVSTYLWAELRAEKSKSSTYTYYWNHAPPTGVGLGSMKGAFHGSELNYVFNHLGESVGRPAKWSNDDKVIAGHVLSVWANFIKTGDPNGSDLPTWPASTKDSAEVMVLGRDIHTEDVASVERIRFWTQHFNAQEKAW